MLQVTCQVSRVTCCVSHVTCHVSHVTFFYKVVELVGGGSVINGPTPSTFLMQNIFCRSVSTGNDTASITCKCVAASNTSNQFGCINACIQCGFRITIAGTGNTLDARNEAASNTFRLAKCHFLYTIHILGRMILLQKVCNFWQHLICNKAA